MYLLAGVISSGLLEYFHLKLNAVQRWPCSGCRSLLSYNFYYKERRPHSVILFEPMIGAVNSECQTQFASLNSDQN